MEMIEKTRMFFTEAAQELRKVTWPSRKEVLASTAVVLVVSVFFMLLIALVDWTVSKGLDFFLK
jgi:preprotein translocase subunit SecE